MASQGTFGYIWSTFDAIKHIRNKPAQWAHVVPTSQFDQDVQTGTLPAISWLTTDPGDERSPSIERVRGRELDRGSYKRNHEISDVATHGDRIDLGRFRWLLRSHCASVPGPYNLGPRVPTIVISPYSRRHFIYHGRLDFRSIDLFIENTFKLRRMAQFKRVGDVSSIAPMLNMTQKPLDPVVLDTHTRVPQPPLKPRRATFHPAGSADRAAGPALAHFPTWLRLWWGTCRVATDPVRGNPLIGERMGLKVRFVRVYSCLCHTLDIKGRYAGLWKGL